MSRIFLSHSSQDNIAAKAFKQWLCSDDWLTEDVFLDIDDIGGGERWKDALRKANARCEAVILLATPEALSSPECIAEVRQAENYGKEIIVVLLRGVEVDDPRIRAFTDRQIVDLATNPQDHLQTVQFRGEVFDVHFNLNALSSIRSYLFKRGISPRHFAWPPIHKPHAPPYPGLAAFTEEDAGIFFGREADIVRGLDRLRILRRDGRPNILMIEAASGAGKSSFLRAGLWPRLTRDPDVVATAILRPATGMLTGPDGLGRNLAALLSRPGSTINPGDVHTEIMGPDGDAAAKALRGYLARIVAEAHHRRRFSDKDARIPAILLAVDQAEEMLGVDGAAEAERFFALLSTLLRGMPDPDDATLYLLLTVRTDAAPGLLTLLSGAGLDAPDTMPLLPVPPTAFREIILEPLRALARGGRRVTLSPALTERLTADVAGADALPLLAFTLSHLFQDFGAGNVIDIEHYRRLEQAGGCIVLAVDRALTRPSADPVIPSTSTAQFACLRKALIPWLVRVDPETGAVMRRVAAMADFPADAVPMVRRLVDARLLVADRRAGRDVVEVAHESLLRQWPKLKEWLATDIQALTLIDDVDRSARQWDENVRGADWLVHTGQRLRAAQKVANASGFRQRLGEVGTAYLAACRARARRRSLGVTGVVGAAMALALLGGIAWRFQRNLTDYAYWFGSVRGRVVTGAQARALTSSTTFRDCTDCPEMVVLPAGNFEMGSLPGQGSANGREYKQHAVMISQPFAVAKFEVTVAEWEACVAHGPCERGGVAKWGQGLQPVVNVTWSDAQNYAHWLSAITARSYRLLSESEYEYATRALTKTAYPWGPSMRPGDALCGDCNPDTVARGTMSVGSFPLNRFGLADMLGNVFEWVKDCFHDDYAGAPIDGSAWSSSACPRRVTRGGSFLSRGREMRSAARDWANVGERRDDLGFRVARTLGP